MNIDPNPGPVPEDILEFLNRSEHGAIMFALGVTFRPADLPSSLVRTLSVAIED